MSQEVERVYTINLGKAWLSPDNQRAKRAINMIKEFARHHMKTEQIRIDQDLSQAVWKRGIRSPPRKIRVKMAKTDEGHVVVSTYEEDNAKTVEEKVEEKSKDKKPTKQPETKVEPEEKIEKVEAKVEEPKEKPAKTEKKPESVKAPEAKKEAKSKKAEEKKTAKKSSAKKPAKKSK